MSTSTAKAQAVDPVTVEIIRNGLLAVTEEMKSNLMRTAYNLIIYEALDFTVGLFTAYRRDDLDRPRAADVHPRHERDGEGEDREVHPRLTSIPGDILVTNDAYVDGQPP